MVKCRIVRDGKRFTVETNYFWFFWFTEYDLVDDDYSIVSPSLYRPLRAPKEFKTYLDALDYISERYQAAEVIDQTY